MNSERTDIPVARLEALAVMVELIRSTMFIEVPAVIAWQIPHDDYSLRT